MQQLRKEITQLYLLLLFAIMPIGHAQFLRRSSNISELMTTRAYDPNNPSECYNILYESDANGDGTVSNDEYQTFVSLLSDGEFNTMSYVDLPFGIKINFVYLNCLCRYLPENAPGGNDCCTGPDGGIFVSGAEPGELPTSSEEEYLNTVCRETQVAIDSARRESSMSPVMMVTEIPTKNPATESPTSSAPTTSPSADPTKSPTDLPSAKPITSAPSMSLSSLPPSLPPTVMPSSSPPSTHQPSLTSPTISTASPTSIKQTLVPTTSTPTLPVLEGTQYPSSSSYPSISYNPSIPPSTSNALATNTYSDAEPNQGTRETETETLPAGGVAGIVLSSVFVLFAIAYIYTSKKRKREEDDPDLRDVRNKDLDDLEAGAGAELNDDEGGAGTRENVGSAGDSNGGDGDQVGRNNQVTDKNEEEDETFIGNITDVTQQVPGIAARSPPRLSRTSLMAGVPHSPKRDPFHDDSSSAGESGWSSSAGLSSLNTASFDNGTDDGLMPGSPGRLLATIGVADVATTAAGSTQRDAKPSFVPIDDDIDESSDISYDDNHTADAALNLHPDPIQRGLAQGKVTREDLNAAIEAGDWAVVGATAALLADSTGGVMDISISGSEYGDLSLHTRDTMSEISDTDDRAKELDRLVETGDWEGVVMAAAQFEDSLDGQDDNIYVYSSKNKSPTTAKDKAEIRSEVEKLVRRVVPDEIDNIDDMMLQFEGREEELVETLRTMQERSLAQRTKAAVHKTAKLEGKAKASSEKSVSSSSEPSYYAESTNSSMSGNAAANNSLVNSISNSSVSDLGMTSADDQSSSRKTTQSSLELAIERGDWRAVGEAAAKMSSEGVANDGSGSSIHSGSVPESQGRQDRVHYLDALISKGDWSGIVAAAGTYQAIDDFKADDNRTSLEEREALAQAQMWQEIARQSSQSKTDAKGAIEATDWAISLERKRIEDTAHVAADEYDDPDPKATRMEDDESV